jgi:site-specific recombinase XerD
VQARVLGDQRAHCRATLPHTFATRLLERGANIREAKELLGRASVATKEIYTHVANEWLRATVELL